MLWVISLAALLFGNAITPLDVLNGGPSVAPADVLNGGPSKTTTPPVAPGGTSSGGVRFSVTPADVLNGGPSH